MPGNRGMAEPEPAKLNASAAKPAGLTELEARRIIACLSYRSMSDRAVRSAFQCPLAPPIRSILEWMPAIRGVHGYVATKKLTELIRIEHGIDERQAYRWVQDAVDGGWVIPKTHQQDKRFTDNVYNPEKRIPEILDRPNNLYIRISKVVEDQLQCPFDMNAGRLWVPEDVYFHPIQAILERRIDIAATRPKSASWRRS